jgi:LytS/YehU family sensor histidine kinase
LAGIFNGAITGSIGGVFYITLGGPLAVIYLIIDISRGYKSWY